MLATGLAVLLLASSALAQSAPTSLTGTWSTKSNSTLTGPSFYDSAKDAFIEPAHTGISYSFTDDGFFESAYYRAISNPHDPACATAILQWQHGTFVKSSAGRLLLEPIKVDGRQLRSDPCATYKTTYSRFNQTETFKSYELLLDPYHKVPRLNLFRFDGSPMAPMYIWSTTPNMLPTNTLHPKPTHTGKASRAVRRIKRAVDQSPSYQNDVDYKIPQPSSLLTNPNTMWYLGLSLSGIGGVLFFWF